MSSWNPGDPIFGEGSMPSRISKNDFTPEVQEELIRNSVGVQDPFAQEKANTNRMAILEADNEKYRKALESDAFLDGIVDKYAPQQSYQQPYQQPMNVNPPAPQNNGMVENNNNNINNIVDSTPQGATTPSQNDDPFSSFFNRTENAATPQTNDVNTGQSNTGNQVPTNNQQTVSQQFQVQNPGVTQQSNVQQANYQQPQQNTSYDPQIDRRRDQVKGVSEYAISKGLDPEAVMNTINSMEPKDLVDLLQLRASRVSPPKTITDIKSSRSPIPQGNTRKVDFNF